MNALQTLSLAVLALASVSLQAQTDTPPNTLTKDEQTAGWKLLFDGKTTDGFRLYKGKDAGKWSVRDGVLVSGGGDLITKDQYDNFEFAAQWKFEKGDNSGIVYRVAETKGPSWQTGPELQLLKNKPGSKLGKNDTGALYDMFAAKENTLKPAEEWNSVKLVCNGKHIEHWINGVKVVEADIGSDEWNKALALSKWKNVKQFAGETKGYIALQDHGGVALFRNIKIRELKDAAK